ncbi:MAG: carboxypeptidase regulatory-like domain-containing protein, partial [Acidobacteria bacterium]|nr:carboxypeptidase regulatory-like domain-containing protein [Acidobacteriota bacterium]
PLTAQSTAELQGEVTDPSGTVIPGATVALRGPERLARSLATNLDGTWTASGLAPGNYTVRITAAGFSPFEARNVNLQAGRTLVLQSQLAIATEAHTVTVADISKISVDPESTASAIVFRGEELDVLSDRRRDLHRRLQRWQVASEVLNS